MGRRFLRSLLAGGIAALCAAAVDALSGFIASDARFQSLAFSVAGMALVAALALAVFMVLRWLLVAPLARRADDHALSVACAMGLAALFVSYDVRAIHTGLMGVFDLFIDVTLAAAVAVGAFQLARNDARSPRHTPARVVGRALPFALPLAAAGAWIGFVKVDDVTSVRFVLTLVLLAAAVIAAGRVASALPPRSWKLGVVGVGGILMATGIVALVAISGYGSLRVGTWKKKHGDVRQVILLTVDTLRRDSLSCYGSSSVQTPNLDRIASRGCLFQNVTSSSSWTLPAFASIMTGLTSREHGVMSSTAVLPDTVITLAERFRNSGYATHALVVNGIIAPHRGFTQGFVQYHLGDKYAPPVSLGELFATRFRHEPLSKDAGTTELTEAAITWLKARKDQDFFLWVHYLDPHLPYDPPVQFVERMNVHDTMGLELDISSATRPSMDLFGDAARRVWARSLYDAEVRFVDSEIGKLVGTLEELGIYDDALLVFAGDHGEEFWDHDGFEHGHTLYQELIGVPLIVKPPGTYAPRVVDDPVAIYDVAPTVLDICGLPPVVAPHAISLKGYIAGTETRANTRPVFSGGTLFRSNFETVVFDGWKYIRSATTGREELFRLADDPAERRSLVLDFPEVAARGRSLVDEDARASRVFRELRGIENPVIKLDADEIARLRALGYL